jgi:hypothetical protein
MQFALALDSTVVLKAMFFCLNERCFLSHDDVMRTGPAMIVQRGDFVITGGCDPLKNLIRSGFANELLAGEPENFTRVGIGFGT